MGAFKPDREAIASLVYEDFVRADLHARAERVVVAAKAIAPYDTGEFRDGLFDEETGQYEGGIHVEDGPGGSVLVAADAPHAVYVELGTSRMEAHHTISSSLDAARD